MEPNAKLSLSDDELIEDSMSYRRLIGKLIYLMISRPDLSYAANKLSQFVYSPRTAHLQAAKRIAQHVKKNPGKGLLLPFNLQMQHKAIADADWGPCPDTRRSVTGLCIFLGDSLVSCKS